MREAGRLLPLLASFRPLGSFDALSLMRTPLRHLWVLPTAAALLWEPLLYYWAVIVMIVAVLMLIVVSRRWYEMTLGCHYHRREDFIIWDQFDLGSTATVQIMIRLSLWGRRLGVQLVDRGREKTRVSRNQKLRFWDRLKYWLVRVWKNDHWLVGMLSLRHNRIGDHSLLRIRIDFEALGCCLRSLESPDNKRTSLSLSAATSHCLLWSTSTI